jgi:hypothetical protein
MKEKLLQLNNTQFDIEKLQKEINKVKDWMIGANKAKIDFYDPILRSYEKRLSILKGRK